MAKFTKLNIGDSVASSGGRVLKKLSAESAEEDSILGTWIVNENISLPTEYIKSVGYKIKAKYYKSTAYRTYDIYVSEFRLYPEYLNLYQPTNDSTKSNDLFYYVDGKVRNNYGAGTYVNEFDKNSEVGILLRTFTIEDISNATNVDVVSSWLKANATKTA